MSPHDGLTAHASVRRAYERRVEHGEISRDPAQEAVADALDRVADAIASKRLATKTSALGWLFGGRQKPGPVRGVYIHGGVGRGKTMLMDMFFAAAPVKRKRRVHFNDFMAEVHDRIGRHRDAVKSGRAAGDDPIPPVAAAIAEEAWVLCFDEFAVTDIADAMILSRLFSALFAAGVVLVATSNAAPDELYADGLNRALFLPFIETLRRHAEIVQLDSPVDYRLRKLARLPVYICPLGPEADRQMDEQWAAMTAGIQETALDLQVKGRKLHVRRAAGRAARFDFSELCEAPLAARDFLAIAARFDTVFLDGAPIMDDAQRNAAKRFILLIDTLYDKRARLVISAAAAPDRLYAGTTGAEAFEFRRTASRLAEMQDRAWFGSSSDAGETEQLRKRH